MFQRREQEFGSWLWVWMIFAAVLLALALAFRVPLAQLEGAERFWPLAVLALLLFSLSRIYVVCRKLEIIRIRDRAFSDRVRCVLWERDPERDRFLQVSRYAIDLLGYPVEDWFKDGFWLDHRTGRGSLICAQAFPDRHPTMSVNTGCGMPMTIR